MQYVILLAVPLIIAAIGGGFITDDVPSKRNIGFALVVIATVGVILQIAWQIADPTYYLH